MAETITCRLINGSSFPLNEQMSNNFCRSQTDTCVRHAVRVCVCVCCLAFGHRPIERWKTISFVRICYTCQWWCQSSRHYIRSTQPTIERHEYTCNLLICLICPKIRWAWLSLSKGCTLQLDTWRSVGLSLYWMYVTPQSIRWFWHRLLRRKLVTNGRCVHVSCAWLAGCRTNAAG